MRAPFWVGWQTVLICADDTKLRSLPTEIGLLTGMSFFHDSALRVLAFQRLSSLVGTYLKSVPTEIGLLASMVSLHFIVNLSQCALIVSILTALL